MSHFPLKQGEEEKNMHLPHLLQIGVNRSSQKESGKQRGEKREGGKKLRKEKKRCTSLTNHKIQPETPLSSHIPPL
jgi:hypothetical protein